MNEVHFRRKSTWVSRSPDFAPYKHSSIKVLDEFKDFDIIMIRFNNVNVTLGGKKELSKS